MDPDSVIRIDDLRRPVLTEKAREALEYAERNPVKLTEKAVLDAARDSTGLNDFGPEEFRPRLRTWLEIVDADENITALGKSIKFDQCVHFASSRLRLQRLLKEHPEILKIEIRSPIIIAGLWRSGTTHLHGLLAADRRLRSLRYRELSDPLASAEQRARGGDAELTAECPKQTISALLPYLRDDLLPLLSSMHPLEPDDVAEDTALQGPDFPLWHDDSEPLHFNFLKTMLKVLQWGQGPDRWVLKSPECTNQLVRLARAFPDATIVMTQRDPVSIVESMTTRMAYSARLDYREVDTDLIGSNFVDRAERILKSALQAREIIPSRMVVDVNFNDLMKDDIEAVKRIYKRAGIETNDEWRSDVVVHRSSHTRYKNGRVLYDLMGDFSISKSELHKRFQFYYSRFPGVAPHSNP